MCGRDNIDQDESRFAFFRMLERKVDEGEIMAMRQVTHGIIDSSQTINRKTLLLF
jgi:hypothetical protein